MNGLPWYRCYPRDFNDGMLGLSLEERGAYVTILNVIYSRGGPVPDDDGYFRALLCCSGRAWVKIRAALVFKRKLFEITLNNEPCLMNRRAAEEIAVSQENSRRLADAGRRGGRNTQSKTKENNDLGQAGLEGGSSDSDTEAEKKEDANASLSPDGDAKAPTKYPPLFELAWKAYPHVKGRSSKPKSLGYWRRLPAAVRDALPAACARFGREGREPKEDCGARAMDRWLRDGLFEEWLAGPEVAAGPHFPEPAVRAAAVIARGESWVVSWLDPCGWDAARRVVSPRNTFAAVKLRQELTDVLRQEGVGIEEKAA